MKFQFCEHEQAVGVAAQQGNLTEELLTHARGCKVCHDIVWIAAALQAHALDRDERLRPPDSVIVWERAQQAARQQAIAKAALPIRMALAGSAIVSILSLPWLLRFIRDAVFKFPIVRSGTPVNTDWIATLSGATGFALSATVICIAVSSWLLARQE